MANEAELINRDGDIHYFTITNQAIPKGTFMVLSDPRTVTLHSSAGQIVVGVTVEEIKAGDGQVRVGVRLRGIVDAVSADAATTGDLAEMSGTANQLRPLNVVALSHTDLRKIVGAYLETATAAERVNVMLGRVVS